jgi:antibiotic biosynthesis monooxygenase (ABM) superfamily enzyme
MDVCVARASAAVVQQVPPTAVDWFVDWQRKITAAAEQFPGYQGTDVYPPADGQSDQWVVIVHFEDDEALEKWLNSPERAQWVAKLRAEVGEFDLKKLPGGFSAWFAGLNTPADEVPPWKMAMTVFFGLYPTVMLLTIFVAPFTSWMGFSYSMLIGNALSVSILQWIVVPMLMVPLSRWLKAKPGNWAVSLGGLGVLLLLLVVIAAMFRLVTG